MIPNTSMAPPQICSYSEFTFAKASHAWDAFKRMGMGPKAFGQPSGAEAIKPLGTGSGNGFSVIPDFKRYALFGIWSSEGHAKDYFRGSEVIRQYFDTSVAHLHLLLQPVKAHGLWNGVNPLRVNADAAHGGPLAVLTRATIRTRKLPDFWRHVPSVSRYMASAQGKLHSVGIGEYPLFMQATFSLWESKEMLMTAAYRDPAHAKVVKLTRERKWYAEEMFAQFALLQMNQMGFDHLQSLMPTVQARSRD